MDVAQSPLQAKIVYLLYIVWDPHPGYNESELEGIFEDKADACNYPETQNWAYWQKTILPYEVKKKSKGATND